jgi:hypothetical protein
VRGFLARQAFDLPEVLLDLHEIRPRWFSTSWTTCARRSASSRCCRRSLSFHEIPHLLQDVPAIEGATLERHRHGGGRSPERCAVVPISARSRVSSAAIAFCISASVMPGLHRQGLVRRRPLGKRRPGAVSGGCDQPARMVTPPLAACTSTFASAAPTARSSPAASASGAHTGGRHQACGAGRGAAFTIWNPRSAAGGSQCARSARTAPSDASSSAHAAHVRDV